MNELLYQQFKNKQLSKKDKLTLKQIIPKLEKSQMWVRFYEELSQCKFSHENKDYEIPTR